MGNTETRELPLTQWTHKHPEEYAKKLIKVWGSPTGVSKHSVSWEMDKRKPYIKVTVVDELIPHKFPNRTKEIMQFFFYVSLKLCKFCWISKRRNSYTIC